VSVFLSPLGKPRAFHVMGSLDGRPAIVAGSGNGSVLSVERYHEYFDKWEVLKLPVLPHERVFSAGFGNLNYNKVLRCL